MNRAHITLSDADRSYLVALLKKGHLGVKQYKRATGLLELDRGKRLTEVASTVRVGHLAGGALRVPDNLSLLRLLPYSPELNAQENIWQLLRQDFLAGRIFQSYEAIVNACCTASNALTAETSHIQSIASRDWLQCVCS